MRGDLRVVGALAALVVLTGLASAGYVWIEGWPWQDALYMAVITLSTVGFAEVAPLSPVGRLYTAGVIVVGVGSALYLASLIAERVLDGRLRDVFPRRTMEQRMRELEGHVIVCGYGRYGAVVVDELRRSGRTVLVVEQDAERVDELVRGGVPALAGNAASDEVLERAGVARANALVVATSSDSENVFITLCARELNPGIEIHARGESDTAIRRLRAAGATSVASLFRLGGLRTAASILRPSVVDFLEISADRDETIEMEEIRVLPGSPVAGREVRAVESECGECRIVALKRPGEPLRAPPQAHLGLAVEDYLVVIGDRASVAQLASAAAPRGD